MPTIMGLIKMCREKKHADDFRKGKLYSNRISYFGDNGNDLLDGVILISPNVYDFKLSCNGTNLPNLTEDMCAPAELRLNRVQNLNIFCMYAIHTGVFDSIGPENLQEFKKHLEIDERCCDAFGEYAVIVHNRNEYFKRVDVAIRRNGFRRRRDLVNYFDSNHQPFTSVNCYNAAFYKRDTFKYEREYRIAIDSGKTGTDPLSLEIGDISDITSCCNSRDINKTIEILLPSDS